MVKGKKKKILALLEESDKEEELFVKHHRFVNLSQACEKTWVAFNLLLEYKLRKELKFGGKALEPFAERLGLLGVYLRARNLHIIHYEGSPGITEEEIFDDLQITRGQIRESLEGDG